MKLFLADFLYFSVVILDINECIDHNGHCQQFCNDTKTSYFCSCRQGFEIDKEDPKVCRGMLIKYLHMYL